MKFVLEAEDIKLKNGWYIKVGSIAWYIVSAGQVVLLMVGMAVPYLLAMAVADCLGI